MTNHASVSQQNPPGSRKRRRQAWLRKHVLPATLAGVCNTLLAILRDDPTEDGLSKTALKRVSKQSLDIVTVALEDLETRGLIRSELVDKPEHNNQARLYWAVKP